MNHGKYIVIEGHDGTGKSTQVTKLRQKLLQNGIDSIEFHEPAGSPIADEIRNLLKNGTLKRDSMTDLLLFSASRHELWYSRAIPALMLGKWVVASRNYYSTLAYQGYGGGLDVDTIIEVTKIATSERYMNPSQSVILDLSDESTRKKRIGARNLSSPDTFESKDDEFQNAVRQGYLKIANAFNLPVIDATASIETVHSKIWKTVRKLI